DFDHLERIGARVDQRLYGTRHVMDALLAPRVARAIGSTPRSVRDRTTVLQTVWGTVVIHARGPSRAKAAKLANVTAAAFVRQRRADLSHHPELPRASVLTRASPDSAESWNTGSQFLVSALLLLAAVAGLASLYL